MKDWKKLFRPALAAAVILAALRWALPLLLPFAVGLLVALCAEPLTRRLNRILPRPVSSGIAMTLGFSLLGLLLWGLSRLALREMALLPRFLEEAAGSLEGLKAWLLEKLPRKLRPGADAQLRSLLSGTGNLPARLLALVTRILGSLPDAFVFLGTAITASFLISVRLPALRLRLKSRLPEGAAVTLRNLRRNLKSWLRAEVKLTGLTFCLLTAGFFLLRQPSPLLLGGLVSLVDALPILGTGTVLVPWALLCLIRGSIPLAAGLGAMYVLCALFRSFLEPRLLGRHLGMNPLLTLAAVYLGYRLWGVLGMILAPILTVTALDLWQMSKGLDFDG